MRSRFVLIALLLIALLNVPKAQLRATPPLASTGDDNVIEHFDIAKDGDLIVLPLKIANKTYPFILDTGSTVVVFDITIRHHLGIQRRRTSVQTFAGNSTLDEFDAPRATIGNMPLNTSRPVYCCDLTRVREASGVDVCGIIGMQFLKDYVIHIDFDIGLLTFLRSADRTFGEPMRLHFTETGRPAVVAELCDRHMDYFVLDTGHLSLSRPIWGTLDEDLFAKLVETHCGIVRDFQQGTALDKQVTSTRARFQGLKVDHFFHEQIDFESANVNCLGLGFLSRYALQIDFPGRMIYMRKGARFAEKTTSNLSGIRFGRSSEGVVIRAIHARCPAAAAGLMVNDLVLEINGCKVDKYSYYRINRMLREVDRKITIRIRRADDVEIEKGFILTWWTP